MIYYILKKDLPDVKAGAMFEIGAATDAYYLTSDKTETKYNCYCYPIPFVENNPEWFERFETVIKPPLGLMPFWLHREVRDKEIKDAMNRYIDAGMVIPKEWRNELESLEGWINGKQKEDAEKKCKSAFDAARITLQNGELKYQDYFDYSV